MPVLCLNWRKDTHCRLLHKPGLTTFEFNETLTNDKIFILRSLFAGYIFIWIYSVYTKKKWLLSLVTELVKIQLSTACLDQALWIPLDFTNAGKNTDLTWKGLLVDNSLKGNKINNNYCYTAENNYFLNSVCSHWLLQNHMTSSNETVSCQNLSRQHCKIYDITG